MTITSKPLKLKELLALKPGSIISGLVETNSGLRVGAEWNLGATPTKLESVILLCYNEAKTQLRKNVRKKRRLTRSNVTVLYPELKELALVVNDACRRAMVTREHIQTSGPVGVFLGYVARFENETYVNILTLSGADVWINTTTRWLIIIKSKWQKTHLLTQHFIT